MADDYDNVIVDRIMHKQTLETIVKTLTQQSKDLTKLLAKKNRELNEAGEELEGWESTVIEHQEKLQHLARNNEVQLSVKETARYHNNTKDYIKQYFKVKPGVKDLVKVKVIFKEVSNKSNTSKDGDGSKSDGSNGDGSNGDGSNGDGSKSAVFSVYPSDPVEELQKTASKYWCLDSNSVFFLDRGGQIIPGSMKLGDVILPQNSDYVVANQYYPLTLVKSSTELVLVDTLVPKGYSWRDFTFNNGFLREQLELHRKLRGQDTATLEDIDATKIPSLEDLVSRGQLKKDLASWDFKCRLLEVFCFFITLICLYSYVIDNYDRETQVVLFGNQVRVQFGHLSEFQENSDKALEQKGKFFSNRRLNGVTDGVTDSYEGGVSDHFSDHYEGMRNRLGRIAGESIRNSMDDTKLFGSELLDNGLGSGTMTENDSAKAQHFYRRMKSLDEKHLGKKKEYSILSELGNSFSHLKREIVKQWNDPFGATERQRNGKKLRRRVLDDAIRRHKEGKQLESSAEEIISSTNGIRQHKEGVIDRSLAGATGSPATTGSLGVIDIKSSATSIWDSPPPNTRTLKEMQTRRDIIAYLKQGFSQSFVNKNALAKTGIIPLGRIHLYRYSAQSNGILESRSEPVSTLAYTPPPGSPTTTSTSSTMPVTNIGLISTAFMYDIVWSDSVNLTNTQRTSVMTSADAGVFDLVCERFVSAGVLMNNTGLCTVGTPIWSNSGGWLVLAKQTSVVSSRRRLEEQDGQDDKQNDAEESVSDTTPLRELGTTSYRTAIQIMGEKHSMGKVQTDLSTALTAMQSVTTTELQSAILTQMTTDLPALVSSTNMTAIGTSIDTTEIQVVAATGAIYGTLPTELAGITAVNLEDIIVNTTGITFSNATTVAPIINPTNGNISNITTTDNSNTSTVAPTTTSSNANSTAGATRILAIQDLEDDVSDSPVLPTILQDLEDDAQENSRKITDKDNALKNNDGVLNPRIEKVLLENPKIRQLLREKDLTSERDLITGRNKRELIGSTSSITYEDLKYPCISERVSDLELYLTSNLMPKCVTHMDEESRLIPSASSFDSSYGRAAYYTKPTSVNYLRSTSLNAFLDDFYSAISETITDDRGYLITFFLYSPGLETVCVAKLLIEIPLSGGIQPQLTVSMVDVRDSSKLRLSPYLPIALVFSLICFIMEIRLLYVGNHIGNTAPGEEGPVKFGIWQIVHFLLPLLLVLYTALFVSRYDIKCIKSLMALAENADPSTTTTSSSLTIDANGTIIPASSGTTSTSTSISATPKLETLDYAIASDQINYVILSFVLMGWNILVFRYVVLFFPQLRMLGVVLLHGLRPLATVVFAIIVVVGIITCLFVSLFIHSQEQFSTPERVVRVAIRIVGGGALSDMLQMRRDGSHNTGILLFITIIQLIMFIIITLILRQLPIAVFSDMLREFSLRTNAEYHLAWCAQNPRTFNPSKHPMKPLLSHPVHPDDFAVWEEEEEE